MLAADVVMMGDPNYIKFHRKDWEKFRDRIALLERVAEAGRLYKYCQDQFGETGVSPPQHHQRWVEFGRALKELDEGAG